MIELSFLQGILKGKHIIFTLISKGKMHHFMRSFRVPPFLQGLIQAHPPSNPPIPF